MKRRGNWWITPALVVVALLAIAANFVPRHTTPTEFALEPNTIYAFNKFARVEMMTDNGERLPVYSVTILLPHEVSVNDTAVRVSVEAQWMIPATQDNNGEPLFLRQNSDMAPNTLRIVESQAIGGITCAIVEWNPGYTIPARDVCLIDPTFAVATFHPGR